MEQNYGINIGGAYDSPTEKRDVIHSALAGAVPTAFDANYSKIPVQMQNKIGICTAEAVCSLIERFRNDGIVLSRRFTYLVGKKLIDGDLLEGSSIKTMIHGAYKYGTQPESVVPTDTTMCYGNFINFDPTPFLATATKIPGYISVSTDEDSLSQGIYIYGGLAVRYECGATWWTDINGNSSWDASKILPLRRPTMIISGHAIVATSYDYTTDRKMTIRNSWSDAWALNGDGYSILTNYAPTEAYGILTVPPVIPKLFTQKMGLFSTGPQVILLQNRLISEGVATFPEATGFFGYKTFSSVRAYQTKHGIMSTGYVGQLTLLALNK